MEDDRRAPNCGSRTAARERRAADEARIRERVLAYLRDRKAFDEGTAEHERRLSADLPLDDLPDLAPRFEALQRVYRTESAITRYGAVLAYTPRPTVDPDRVRILGVTIRRDWASMRTVEERTDGAEDVLPPDHYSYI